MFLVSFLLNYSSYLFVIYVSYKFGVYRSHKRKELKYVSYKKIGEKKDNKNLIFIHGWPDNTTVWDEQIDALKSKYNLYLIELPGFDINDRYNIDKWGYTFTQVSNAILNTINDKILTNDNKNEKVILITHDWGAFIGLKVYELNPDKFERMVMLDVADGFLGAGNSFGWICFGIFYQWYNILSFLLPDIIGDFLSRTMATFMRSPLSKENKQLIHSTMGYFYLVLWIECIFGRNMSDLPNLKHGKKIKCPLLFFYGDKNPLKFHTIKWKQNILQNEKINNSKYVCMKNSGHWMMKGKEKDKFNQILKQWLDNSTNVIG